MAGSLKDRFGLHGKALKLTVEGINTEKIVDTRIVELTVKLREHHDFEPPTINPLKKESLRGGGSDIIILQTLQGTYPLLAVIDPVTYSNKDNEMKHGQYVYHLFHPIEYFTADEPCRTLTHMLGPNQSVTIELHFDLDVF